MKILKSTSFSVCVCVCAAFSRDELLEALLPVLDLVYKQEPEACPFWEPVDPTRLGIPVSFAISFPHFFLLLC